MKSLYSVRPRYGLDTHDLAVRMDEELPDKRCSLGLFETEGSCRSGPLDETFAIPGTDQWKKVEGVSGTGKVLLGVMTLGLNQPEPYLCQTTFKLVRSAAGASAPGH